MFRVTLVYKYTLTWGYTSHRSSLDSPGMSKVTLLYGYTLDMHVSTLSTDHPWDVQSNFGVHRFFDKGVHWPQVILGWSRDSQSNFGVHGY